MSEDMRKGLKSGMIVRAHQKIKETNTKGEEKERIQIFEGTIIAVKHGSEPGATITVRKISNGVGVEKIFPINSPIVVKIELVREMKVRQAKAGYLRKFKKKLREVRKDKSGKEVIEKVENEILEVPESEKEEIEPMIEEVVAEEVVDEKVETKIEEKVEEPARSATDVAGGKKEEDKK